MNRHLVLLLLLAMLSAVSCATSGVQRVAVEKTADLSGRWNDTDAQLTSQAMIDDVLRSNWIKNFVAEYGRKPVIIVGEIRNRSSEHIETLVFTKALERELVNSGQVKFVASQAERVGIRDERTQQQSQASLDSMKRLGQETGADLYLSGVITSITDAIQGKRAVFYQVTLELINIESNEKVWIGEKQIKKLVEQAKYKF